MYFLGGTPSFFYLCRMLKLTSEIFKWIEEHQNDDVTKLRLRYHKQMTAELDFAIMQIECRKKATKKLYQTLQNKQFVFPTTLSAEQCTSDLLSKFHATLIDDGVSLVDLTSGLGIDVYHFAQKAKSVTAVERIPEIAQAVIYNAEILRLNNVDVENVDCCEFVKKTNKHFDVAFIDPARRGDGGKRLFALCDCEPDVTVLVNEIKKKCNKLIVKVSPMLDISQVQRELPGISEIYAIGTPQECKEIVVILDFVTKTKFIKIHAVTLDKEKTIKISFIKDEESNSLITYQLPQEGGYLYEPFPSVMKIAPFKLLSKKYNVGKLHSNTHLYTSHIYRDEFPGEVFKIEHIIPFSSKEIKRFSMQYPQINVATRNFMMSADDLRLKLKVKDGGDKRVFGCTILEGSRHLIVTSKV